MTLQDYINLSQESINSFFSNLGPVAANIVAAAVILVVGLIVGSILKRVWDEILKAINLEKSLSGWSSYQKLIKSHDDLTITTLGGELLRWLAIVVFLLPAVAALGVNGSSEVLTKLLSYLPNVVLASLFLVLGFVFSWFAHRLVMAIGVLVDRNPSHLIADVAALAIMIFATLEAFMQLGIGADLIRLLIIATIAAGALAFGLAGKDSATDLIKKFMDRAAK